MKFQRRGKSDKATKVTLSGDEIIGDIIRSCKALIPIAVSPHGHLGSLIERFLYGTDALPITNFTDGRVHAEAASRVARSPKVPRAVLQRANDIWKTDNPDTFYGTSYKAMDPMRYFQQQLGLTISKAISSHLIRAHNKNKSKRPLECKCDDICETTYHSVTEHSETVLNGCGASCSHAVSTAGSHCPFHVRHKEPSRQEFVPQLDFYVRRSYRKAVKQGVESETYYLPCSFVLMFHTIFECRRSF